MEVNKRDRTATSARVLENFAKGEALTISVRNTDIASVTEVSPGIFEVRVAKAEATPLIVSGGIHGDEKAGINVLDFIMAELSKAKTKVHRNLLLIYGNLEAMGANDGLGIRCVEPEFGELSNLNRCFGHGQFEQPENYAQRRANEIMAAVDNFVTNNGVPDVIDIHQSFNVPPLKEVRGGAPDRSEYTYAMAYPVHGEEESLRWFYDSYSDIVAAVVLNDMTRKHHTFAGYTAEAYGANASTFEQGTIGYVDHDTFVPQLRRNLLRKIGGENQIGRREGYDVWKWVRDIKKRTANFRFVDAEGRRAEAPFDFLPVRRGDRGLVAIDGEEKHELGNGERLLFANPNVPIGDRAAAVVVHYQSNVVPLPE